MEPHGKSDFASDLLKRLKRLDSCAVSDALDKLGIAGASTGLSRLSSTQRVSGRVLTVKLDVSQPTHQPSRHLGSTAITSAEPGDVIVVEQRTGIEAGSWGGILTLAAKVRGVACVISDGLVRDLDEARQYGFPIFARGTTVRTARGRVVEVGNNVPVEIGGVTVDAGDFVVADSTGVVFIPAARLPEVLEHAEAIAYREAAMAKDILAGLPVTEVMGIGYERMLHKEAP